MNRSGFIYIMTNINRTTLYIGVTNDLCRRIYEHKKHLIKNSFTDKYNLEYCIYYEEFEYFDLAIQREKELKKWNRQKKEALINKKNPEWKELVTERGFVRDCSPAREIPPCGRNDESPEDRSGKDSSLTLGMTDTLDDNERENGGGFAATILSPSSSCKPVIPNATQWREESPTNSKTASHSDRREEYNTQKLNKNE